ncbi:VOC family protein [Crystallibacter crystallopoietes]|uniref:VOC family protein n=1 Tax=Crystallibacter crystallopoietes TaxID=37928 RepID=UPI00307C3CEF
MYFGVENIDAAIQTALGLGGQLLQPAEDTPFGKMATLADPTGAVFRLNQVLIGS